MIKKLYKFTFPNGYVAYSRHKQPDFAYMLSDEEIIKQFNREEVTDPEKIEQNIMRR